MTQIFRITHIDNLPFILRHGLHCPNAEVTDPDFVPIGYPTLIAYRSNRAVPVEPGGMLADYVPFYLWPKSPMLYVIHRGNDPEVISTPQKDIIYLVSSFDALQEHGCRFVYTDRHAKLEYAVFHNDPTQIDRLNWPLIKTDEWGRQYGAERKELKQAECLVHRYVPLEALLGIAVMTEESAAVVNGHLLNSGCPLSVKVKPTFYF